MAALMTWGKTARSGSVSTVVRYISRLPSMPARSIAMTKGDWAAVWEAIKGQFGQKGGGKDALTVQ